MAGVAGAAASDLPGQFRRLRLMASRVGNLLRCLLLAPALGSNHQRWRGMHAGCKHKAPTHCPRAVSCRAARGGLHLRTTLERLSGAAHHGCRTGHCPSGCCQCWIALRQHSMRRVSQCNTCAGDSAHRLKGLVHTHCGANTLLPGRLQHFRSAGAALRSLNARPRTLQAAASVVAPSDVPPDVVGACRFADTQGASVANIHVLASQHRPREPLLASPLPSNNVVL